ncbi:hypothetical protein HY634_00305 [Candidatus Uhrbacteria bacterium]|nr:hypothetical protein [Candidatus Uhrbacteria bacterium]
MDFVLVLVLVLVPILATFAYASVRGAPWVPTWRRDVERFLKLAQLKPGERFYDLGCGDGRLVRAAADVGAIATGFECSLLPYLLAKFRVGRRGSVRYADFWNADLSDANVVYCFLMPKVYPKLKEKLERGCRSGTRVILYVWPMKGWEIDAVSTASERPKLYHHLVP